MTQPMKTAIVTDSSCDLSDEQFREHQIEMISLRIVCQNAEYRDRTELNQEQLYEMLKTEVPKTSLPLPEDVSNLYDRLLADGVTDVVHLCISAGLSGTYNMVRMIAADYEGRMNIRVVDSGTLSIGLGMMVLAAAQALEAGEDPESAIQRAKTMGHAVGFLPVRGFGDFRASALTKSFRSFIMDGKRYAHRREKEQAWTRRQP